MTDTPQDTRPDAIYETKTEGFGVVEKPLSLAERTSRRDIALLGRLARNLEDRRLIVRRLEALPTGAEFTARAEARSWPIFRFRRENQSLHEFTFSLKIQQRHWFMPIKPLQDWPIPAPHTDL